MSEYVLNHITVSGTAAHVPDLRYTSSGRAVASVKIYSNRKYEVGGEKREETVEFKVVAWGDAAEALHDNVGKGDFIEVQGRVMTPEAWYDKTEVDKDGKPLIKVINVVNAIPGLSRVVYTKRVEGQAPIEDMDFDAPPPAAKTEAPAATQPEVSDDLGIEW